VRPGSYFVSCWIGHKDPFQVDGATHIWSKDGCPPCSFSQASLQSCSARKPVRIERMRKCDSPNPQRANPRPTSGNFACPDP
jgi:hypothetical protein